MLVLVYGSDIGFLWFMTFSNGMILELFFTAVINGSTLLASSLYLGVGQTQVYELMTRNLNKNKSKIL